jgi:hypothetical protein
MAEYHGKCPRCGPEHPFARQLIITKQDDGGYEATVTVHVPSTWGEDTQMRFMATVMAPRAPRGSVLGQGFASRPMFSGPLTAGTELNHVGSPRGRSPSPPRATAAPAASQAELEINIYTGTDTLEMFTPAKARAIAGAYNDIAAIGDLLLESFPNLPAELQPFLRN